MVRRTEVAAMSERSIYLRDQADKCLRHARSLTDSETQAQLRKLVAEYFQHAVDLEQEQVLTKDAVTVASGLFSIC